MYKALVGVVTVALFSVFSYGTGGAAEYKEAGVLLSKLKESKHSLADGVMQAGQTDGYAISAKFEMDGDELSLSVYTAAEGRGPDAEHNRLMELAGNPTKETWEPKKEVFEDKAHIARAATHLTLMQLTSLGLVEAIEKAAARQPGTVYSVTPAIRDCKPVFDVLVATSDDNSVALTLDLQTGRVSQ